MEKEKITKTDQNKEDQKNLKAQKSDIKNKSIDDVELCGNFNTMVVDCEGCFIDIFNNFKNYILQNVTTIIIENDRLNHNKIFEILIKNNFKIVENYFNHILILIKTV